MTERSRNIICQGSIPEFENDGDNLDKVYIPVRGLQVAVGKEDSLVVLPDAMGVREFVSDSKQILGEIGIPEPESVLVPDTHYFLDKALEASLELIEPHLSEHGSNILWPYANTEVSDGWIDMLRSRGYKFEVALPRKEYRFHQTRSGWGRRISRPNEPSFPERHHIPYPISYISRGLSELEEAYNKVSNLSESNSVYLKLSASAGGFGLARVESEEEVRNFYNVLKESNQLYLFGDPTWEQEFEVQEEIRNICGFGSIQYLGDILQTPSSVSMQLLDGNNWVGNKFNVINGRLSKRASKVFRNFSNGMQLEHPEDAGGWGGLDIAFVGKTYEDMDLIVVENNWGRITGAHPGIYFANALNVSDRPFMVQKMRPPKVDASECWKMLKAENISFDPNSKRGAVPFPWVKDVDAFLFVVGESDEDIMDIADRVMNLTYGNGYH